MKKVLSLGIAGLMAAAMTLAAGSADARPYGGYRSGPGVSFYFGGSPFYFGFQSAPPRRYFRPPMYMPRPYVRLSRHDQWCSWRYRTYNPVTNTYHPRVGVTAYCVSPFRPY